MKEIKLTKGKVVLVDDEDFERLNQFKWFATFSDGKYYAGRQPPRNKTKRKAILMHREIMGTPKGLQVDHRNGDGLYNCKENLRNCTNQQNHQNLNYHRDNILKIKGVSWDKKYKKFVARIKANGKPIILGYFNVLGDADSAYRIAEERYFGKFARAI